MKKIITLAIAAGMFVAAAAPASAVDVKVDGEYTFVHTQRGMSTGGDKTYSKDDRTFQRFDLGLTATVSENLSGYFQVRSDWQWGTNSFGNENRGDAFKGAYNNSDAVRVQVRQAYIDWLVPQTTVKVRMGRQAIRLPGLANGKNPAIWSKDPVDGIVVSSPVTDWLSLTGFWGRYSRTWKNYAATDVAGNLDNTCDSREVDAFGIAADMKFDGFRVEPFLAYAHIGQYLQGGTSAHGNKINNSFEPAGRSHAFWAGFAATLNMFDPFVAKLGFVYGDRSYNKDRHASQHGWLIDAKASYKTEYGTPEILLWYGSGDHYESGSYASHGHLPGIGGRFGSTFGWGNGSRMIENELYNNHTGAGTWGVRLGVSNVSFLEDLTHELYFAYIGGTNDKNCGKYGQQPWRYMTSRDGLFEIDFGTTYKIYKNLTAAVEVAYVIEGFKKHNDGNFAARASKYDNAWKALFQLQYKF